MGLKTEDLTLDKSNHGNKPKTAMLLIIAITPMSLSGMAS